MRHRKYVKNASRVDFAGNSNSISRNLWYNNEQHIHCRKYCADGKSVSSVSSVNTDDCLSLHHVKYDLDVPLSGCSKYLSCFPSCLFNGNEAEMSILVTGREVYNPSKGGLGRWNMSNSYSVSMTMNLAMRVRQEHDTINNPIMQRESDCNKGVWKCN